MTRSYNFSAGPAVLPEEVLTQASQELLEWRDGVSVLEHSHRSGSVGELIETLRQQFRDLLKIPKNYQVLLMQGGATGQFAAVPMNLLRDKKTADYIATGFWSQRAIAEGKLYCDVNIAADNSSSKYTTIPPVDSWKLNPNAAYVHYAPNETIHGVEFPYVPETGDVPLVADMSSNILSKPINIKDYAVIYAGSQKNIAPSGLTLVIVREDLIGHAMPITPAILDYKRFTDEGFYNTPTTFTIYLAHLALKWLEKQGGVEAIESKNIRKSNLLYKTIDESNGFYFNNVEPKYRSRMNIPFSLSNTKLDKLFLEEAAKEGLINLFGHKSAGGMRASLYNAMPEEGVKTLTTFMTHFANLHR